MNKSGVFFSSFDKVLRHETWFTNTDVHIRNVNRTHDFRSCMQPVSQVVVGGGGEST